MKRPVIFCDFDGTVTEKDNIVATIAHFDPPGWKTIVDDVVQGRQSIRRGVGELFALLPSSRREEIVDFSVRNATIRAGFRELLEFCRQEDIEFLITSGGIDFFVHPLLAPYPIDKERIYCNRGNFAGERVLIEWPHSCDEHCPNQGCGMCKTTVIRRYPADRHLRILIGDSVTDFEGAKLADIVFARSHLIERCRELGVPYHPFETFHDVVRKLNQLGIGTTAAAAGRPERLEAEQP